ncbi:MAG TPA: CDP-alcohol phosphatidyltransferase family protein [Candidatus Binatia bacterium]|nr:CDP-alcohol phosphatidyltransferase family protein [Candidatus Binatia bacterium]
MTPPIREAIVLAGPGDATRAVAGVPLLVRTILALERGGVERCTLVGTAAPPADPRIRCAVVAAPALEPPADDGLRLVVGAGAVIDASLVCDLQRRARPGAVLEVAAAGAWVRVAPGPLVAGASGARRAPAAGTLAAAAAPAAAVEEALLRALENPRDGYLDRLLHRRLSRPLTRLVLRTPLGPNGVTLLGITAGVLGGGLIGVPGVAALAAGVACLVLSGVLDCVDGEVARLRFAESRFGHWLDVIGDTLVHVALLAGIAVRLAQVEGVPGRGTLVLLGAGVAGAFAVITWSEQTEGRRRRLGHAWENRVLDGVLSPLTTRDWYAFPVAFALAGRLSWLVPAAAVGANVFWAVTGVVLLRALRRGSPVDGTSFP